MVRKAHKTVDLNPEAEVSNPEEAAKLQLEMLEQRVTRARTMLKLKYKYEFDEAIKNMRHHFQRLFNLTYNRGQASDRRLIDCFKRASMNTGTTESLSVTEGVIYLEGTYDIAQLSKLMTW